LQLKRIPPPFGDVGVGVIKKKIIDYDDDD